MPRKNDITVSTRVYEGAHGRQPRGRGSWAFYFAFGPATAGGTVEPWFAPGCLTFTEARRAAQAEARTRGFRHVEVGS